MKKSGLEWLKPQIELMLMDGHKSYPNELEEVFEVAKEMEKQQSKEYAEFAVLCDRQNFKILEFDGFINLSQQEKP
jgi:hypothetical protein